MDNVQIINYNNCRGRSWLTLIYKNEIKDTKDERIQFLKKHHNFYDEEYGFYDYDDGEAFYNYDDNSYLVDMKIKELQYELDKRKEK